MPAASQFCTSPRGGRDHGIIGFCAALCCAEIVYRYLTGRLCVIAVFLADFLPVFAVVAANSGY